MQPMDEVASEAVLDQAYTWLCKRRRAFPPGADVWPGAVTGSANERGCAPVPIAWPCSPA